MTVNGGYLTFMIAQCHGFICTSFFVPFQSLFRCFWLTSWFVLTFVSSHTLASLWFLCWSLNKCIQLPISYPFSVKSNLSKSELKKKNQLYPVSPFQTILILVFHSVWQNPLKPAINMPLLCTLYQLCYWYHLHPSRI